MDKEQKVRIYDILKKHRKLYSISYDLNIISEEFINRIPDKHHQVINDLIFQIEDIADDLSELEKDLYHEYLTLSILEEEEEEERKDH